MRRRLPISTLFALGVFAVTAAGQYQPPPPMSQPKTAEKPADLPSKKAAGDAKKADPADAAVAAALANDPDVKVALAKVQLAEAELAKAKQGVVLKVMTLRSTIDEHRRAVALSQDRVAVVTRMFERAMVPQSQVLEERSKLETAQAALAKAETELKLISGGGGKEMGAADTGHPDGFNKLATRWLGIRDAEAQQREAERLYAEAVAAAHAAWAKAAPAGAIPDRLRAALDKPVKLGAKGEKVPFDKALEVFKSQAGFDIPIRPGHLAGEVVSQGEEMPLGAWLQLYQDINPNSLTLYVREYGLLVARKDAAPPDAPTLTEFWKQKAPAAAKTETAPEPKSKSK